MQRIVAAPARHARCKLAWRNIRMIPTSDILFFQAEDGYAGADSAEVHPQADQELIDELDPDEFWQIHRATLVRVDAVEQVSRNFRGKQIVHVKGSEEKLEVSRSFSHLFKQM
jgi:DNA-binding LytR/AlgR family response regulator